MFLQETIEFNRRGICSRIIHLSIKYQTKGGYKSVDEAFIGIED